MTETIKHQLVTIIGPAYFRPIADLLDKLTATAAQEENQVQAGYSENGYSASVCILSVVCLESFIMRVRYINRGQFPIGRESVHEYLRRIYADFDMLDELSEVFIVRDALVHNHLWEIDYSLDDDLGRKLINAQKEHSCGDHKYNKHVDLTSQKTTRLGLNVNPSRIGKKDAYKVLKTMWNALLFLESKNRNQCNVSIAHVRFRDKMMNFGELIQGLRDTI